MEKIDWSKIKGAHGTCEHIPDAILGLTSEDEEVRHSSYWRIDNYVILQSDLYEGAS